MASVTSHPNFDDCHILYFASDKDDRTSLLVLVNNVRIYIFVDPSSWNARTKLAKEYRKLAKAAWQHDTAGPCSQPDGQTDEKKSNSDSHDSGHATGSEHDSDDADSAVDVKQNDGEFSFEAEAAKNPVWALKKWILSPFGPIIKKIAPAKDAKQKLTVQEWLDELPLHRYTLIIEHSKLGAKEEETSSELVKEIDALKPVMKVPKYLRHLGIPWYSTMDATVLSASEESGKYRPARVEVDGEAYFLKIADPTQLAPTHREIHLLKRIEELGLHKQMKVPQVKGLLGHGNSHTDVLGFLQTDIEDPRPLTTLLDEDVPQEKRDKWAKESERMIEILHKNDIVWGDAKADNFMVDKNDDLWIIDFGGSYTDGWVPPDLVETEQGDDIGVEKIVNALHDPVANTSDPGVQEATENDRKDPPSKKRKAVDDDEDSDAKEEKNQGKSRADSRPEAKRARNDDTSNQDAEQEPEDGEEEQKADDGGNSDENAGDHDEDKEEQINSCICGKPDSGEMVGCDGEDCQHGWFHFSCVGLQEAPMQEHWYCKNCKPK